MNVERLRWLAMSALLALAAASCSGGNQQPGPQLAPLPQTPTLSNANSRNYQLSTADGISIDLRISASTSLPTSAVALDRSVMLSVPGSGLRQTSTTCPSIPPIRLSNPFSFAITVQIVAFTITVPCSIPGSLFGATFYQVIPQPATIDPIKLGNATVSGSTIAFSPTVQSITFPAKTTSQITILPETSTSDVAFPVAPGSTTNLTPISSNLPSGSGLSFTYSTSTGATMYTAACFNAFPSGLLATVLQPVPLVGTPSFYCQIVPTSGTSITFGTIVTFDVTLSQSDGAIFEPDGTPQGYACTNANTCKVPQFTIGSPSPASSASPAPVYQTFISGNVQNLRLCVPATPDVDCNDFDNDPQGGSLTTVTLRKFPSDFQLLVADDPTYFNANNPGAIPPSPVPGAPSPMPSPPWSGLFNMSLSGQCHLDMRPDNDNGDVPPGYTDVGQTGVGPAAEFDVTATGAGTCTITAAEDPKYITIINPPASPAPRSASITITIAKSSSYW
jgi:hypothetical protein